jgi:hypothetical protein
VTEPDTDARLNVISPLTMRKTAAHADRQQRTLPSSDTPKVAEALAPPPPDRNPCSADEELELDAAPAGNTACVGDGGATRTSTFNSCLALLAPRSTGPCTPRAPINGM